MIWRTIFSFTIMLFTALLIPIAVAPAADEIPNELLTMIVTLVADKDPDFRAAGLDHVRDGAKGEAATKLFAEQLPKLPPENQVSLLNALSDRGDISARPALLSILSSSPDETVRAAAILALGQLGNDSDLPLLVKSLSTNTDTEKAAARQSLSRTRGDGVSRSLVAMLPGAAPNVKALLIEVLATRRAKDAITAFVDTAIDDNPQVRTAAMNALGRIGSSDHIGAMLPGVLKASKGGERDAAEKNVALVCSRIDKEDLRADALIKAMESIPANDRDQLLSLVGRVGGKKLIEYVGSIARDENASRRKLAVDALSKWPDASVANLLREITEKTSEAGERSTAFQAYVKVCAARDKRSDKQRLDSLKEAFKLAKNPEEQSLVINRSRTAYTVETLRFVLPYLEDSQFAQIAAETIVELAHHREVRDPNKAEFDKALDRVVETSENATVVERAKAYKKGETWSRT
jgi:HEAT repeat protein